MDRNQAKEILKRFAIHGCIVTTKHCRDRMLDRGVTTEDILHALMWGNIKNIERDTEHNNWKCVIEGKDLENEILTVQAAVSEDERTIIITVY